MQPRSDGQYVDGGTGDNILIGGFFAGFVDSAPRRELFVFAKELLDAPHGDRGSGPVDADGETNDVHRGECPGMRIGPQRREFPADAASLASGPTATIGAAPASSCLRDNFLGMTKV